MEITFINFINNLISTPSLFVITILISVVIFMNGLNDAPNAIATCVSTRCLKPKRALILVAVFNSLGVLIMTFISTKVAETMFNIVNFGSNTHYSLIALASGLIAIVIWSLITYYLKIPSSQSHALIAGISGAAIALKGDISGVDLNEWNKVIYGLIIVNLLAFILGFLITKLIEKICKKKDRRKTNNFFKKAQIFGAGSMSFMHGSQDGQKFMGIFLLGVMLSNGITELNDFAIPLWLISYCSILIAVGAIIGGMRIIKTVGTKVTKLEKYQGTAVDIASSICLFGSSAIRNSCKHIP